MQESSKPALPSDHVWYHSEGDEVPMGSCSLSKTKESSGQDAESGMTAVHNASR
jgi:hypothetical protein